MDHKLFILKKVHESLVLRYSHFCGLMFIKAVSPTFENGMSQVFCLLTMASCFMFLWKRLASMCNFCFSWWL